ncbi:MAG TPA: PTS system mannose/fructose/sorbose family transporter subunit IID [Anaerovoracaceae bacterium]|nr:PTS system mannose/fructose/sorbose family transporter subunit IID [Anaerovoracaceae bacterium]
MSIIQVLLIAALYAWSRSQFPITSFSAINHGVSIGLVVGFIMGDPVQGLIIGATINMMYLGMINVGAAGAVDQPTAAFFAVGMAMATGLSPEAAVTVALPLGVIGTFIATLEKIISVPFYGKLVGAVKAGNLKRMYLWNWAGGGVKYIISFSIMFIGLYFGQGVVGHIVENLPAWADHGFTAIGNLIPAIGISLGLTTIIKGKDASMAYFIIAFFMAKLIGLSTLAVCVFAGMLIWIVISNDIANAKKAGKTINLKVDNAGENKPHVLSLKTVTKACHHFILFQRCIINYHVYSGGAYLLGMYPVMKALYPNDPGKQRDELMKYDAYFQTTPSFNGLIMGSVIAMEEERAMGKEVPVEAITAVKAGLMGPIAGFGDPVWQGVFQALLCTIGIALGVSGNILGGLLVIFGNAIMFWTLAGVFGRWSYKGGSKVTDVLFSSGLLDYVMKGARILGCSAFGALAAGVVKVKTAIAFEYNGYAFDLQSSLFDAVIFGLLPLLAMLLTFTLMKKGVKVVRLLLIYMVVAFVLGSVGILA